MKKFFVLMGLMILSLSLVACGRKKKEEVPKESTVPQTSAAQTQEQKPVTEEEAPADTGADDTMTGETVGKILLADFEQYVKDNPQVTAQEMADHILTNPIIQFGSATMAVEEGLLTGFNNAEITGFEEGVMFAPMIGSIPFVGYIFTLGEQADADAFLKLLTDNADPRWNICTQADETITGKAENLIFFVMSPAQFE